MERCGQKPPERKEKLVLNKDSSTSWTERNKQPVDHQSGIASGTTVWPGCGISLLPLSDDSPFTKEAQESSGCVCPPQRFTFNCVPQRICLCNSHQKCFHDYTAHLWVLWPSQLTWTVYLTCASTDSATWHRQRSHGNDTSWCAGKENDRVRRTALQKSKRQVGESHSVCLDDTILVFKQRCAWACF